MNLVLGVCGIVWALAAQHTVTVRRPTKVPLTVTSFWGANIGTIPPGPCFVYKRVRLPFHYGPHHPTPPVIFYTLALSQPQ